MSIAIDQDGLFTSLIPLFGGVPTAESILIAGQWRAGSGGETFPVTDPSNGVFIANVAEGTEEDVLSAIDAAAIAQPEWERSTAYQRSDVLRRAHQIMAERAEDLARLMTLEQGKPLRAARTEVSYAADFLIWFAEEAKRLYGRTIPSARADQRFIVQHQAVGVVGAITPWNYPISMITRKIGPAIAAGCAVVLKPAAQTPLTAIATLQILMEAGLPAGVVNMVTTSKASVVGNQFTSNPKVDKITFTGSTGVGKLLAGQAASNMKRVSMELGGHAPFIVFADADPVHAAKGAAAIKLLNTGQACIVPNRYFVHRSIADEFTKVLVERLSKFRIGNGFDSDVTVGPLIDQKSVDRMQSQVDDAVGKGATILTGGHKGESPELEGGNFYEPTVLGGVTRDMDIFWEETFGPLAPILIFDDEEEVIRQANDTEYGLASYIYTRDISRIFRVTERLKYGMVGVNDINPTSAAAPFGGVKQSGLGREGAAEGIHEYLDSKLIGLSV